MGRARSLRGDRAVRAVALLAAATACASGGTAPPPAAEGAAEPAPGFEAPPRQRASEIWSAAVVRGDHYQIEEEVVTDGFYRIYRVRSDYGDFEARGDDVLARRLREIQALTVLDERGQTQEFAKALGQALATPLVATWNLVTRPVGTVIGIPLGMARFLAGKPGLASGQRGELEESSARDLIGFSSKKRKLAFDLGVDPYSSNPALQRELNRYAWVAYAGGLPFNLAPFLRAEPLQKQIALPATPPSLAEKLLLSPEELRKENGAALERMGVPEATRRAFLGHPWYSPRHQTVITASLAALDVTEDRDAFVRAALSAEAEADANFYQRSAQLLRDYHENDVRLSQLVALGTLAAGYTPDRALVVPLLVDYLAWTPRTEALADALGPARHPGLEVREVSLLLTGSASPRAREALEARGIRVTEGAAARLEGAP